MVCNVDVVVDALPGVGGFPPLEAMLFPLGCERFNCGFVVIVFPRTGVVDDFAELVPGASVAAVAVGCVGFVAMTARIVLIKDKAWFDE